MRAPAIALLALATACGGSSTTGGVARGSSRTPDRTAATAALNSPAGTVPDIVLPADPLRALVPRTADLPPGMVAILAGSGPRDARAIATYSADPKAAGTLLSKHGFAHAYVAQYADPATGEVLSVVVSRFATAAGAAADLQTDLAASTGQVLALPTVGAASQARSQPLPGGKGQLVTVRFDKGTTTWLVAYGGRSADPAVALGLARALAARA